MQPVFKLICYFAGESTFQVADASGSYRAAIQECDPGAYWRSCYNGTPAEFDRDVLGRIGILYRDIDCRRQMAPETLAAFNAWRASEHAAAVRQTIRNGMALLGVSCPESM